ncbi:MAG: hypothetical protein VCD00_03435 [Candidatus Hydrogenedentota bacterium]
MSDAESIVVERIEVREDCQIYFVLKDTGKSHLQHIYREGREVYWDPRANAFKSTQMTNRDVVEWFRNIIETCQSVGISLEIDDSTKWVGEVEKSKIEICRKHGLDL